MPATNQHMGNKTMSDYNGWTNYATWRVNLEIFDGVNPYETFGRPSRESAYEMGLCLKDYAEEILEQEIGNAEGLAFSYAMAFLSDVNWTEIARHMIEEHSEEAA
jgi:hypothetical protein